MSQAALEHPELTLSTSEREAVRNNGTVQIGLHTLSFEGELARLKIGGHMPLPEVIHVHLFFEEMLRMGRRVFLLSLAHSRPDSTPPEVRRWLAQWNRTHRASGIAMVTNLSWASNVMVSLLMRAISTLRGTPLPANFFSNETEARTWLEALMRQPAK